MGRRCHLLQALLLVASSVSSWAPSSWDGGCFPDPVYNASAGEAPLHIVSDARMHEHVAALLSSAANGGNGSFGGANHGHRRRRPSQPEPSLQLLRAAQMTWSTTATRAQSVMMRGAERPADAVSSLVIAWLHAYVIRDTPSSPCVQKISRYRSLPSHHMT